MARKANKVEVKCETCGIQKIITERAYNDNKTKRFYCNSECRSKDRFKQIDVSCPNCGKEFWVPESQFNRTKSKKFYCSVKCRSEHSNILSICSGCGKEFIKKSYDKGGLFCSNECYFKSIRNRVKTNCAFCGKEIEKSRHQFDTQDNCFCSRECLFSWQRENWQGESHPNYSQIEISCGFCGKQISRNKWQVENRKYLFCDSSCLHDFMKSDKSWGRKDKHLVPCSNCGKELLVSPAEVDRYCKHFCDSSCKSEFNVGENNPNWRGGLSFQDYGMEFNETLKGVVRNRDNRTCQLCGEVETDRKHDCHHIDYCKENNVEENLISLCRANGCHSKTNGNRKYWEKYFKELIEQKYNNLLDAARSTT
ncbi:MAG: hypothetical protein WC055_00295 [Melioribacteraceae bacterium]